MVPFHSRPPGILQAASGEAVPHSPHPPWGRSSLSLNVAPPRPASVSTATLTGPDDFCFTIHVSLTIDVCFKTISDSRSNYQFKGTTEGREYRTTPRECRQRNPAWTILRTYSWFLHQVNYRIWKRERDKGGICRLWQASRTHQPITLRMQVGHPGTVGLGRCHPDGGRQQKQLFCM